MPVLPRTRVGRWAAVIAGSLAAIAVTPIAVAVVLLRCCDDARGPTAAAWAVMAAVVAALCVAGVVVAGLLVHLIERLAGRGRRP